MIAPAARAALMATLSMGWRLDDINCVKNWIGPRTIAAAKGAFSHENRVYSSFWRHDLDVPVV
jgi:hypothetical protein